MENWIFAQRTNDIRPANQLDSLIFARRTTNPRLVRLANQSARFSTFCNSPSEHLKRFTKRVERFLLLKKHSLEVGGEKSNIRI
jgi:hypothetical protein